MRAPKLGLSCPVGALHHGRWKNLVPAMPSIRANGIDLYYELGGAGDRLLFISGTGGDLRVKPNVFDGAFPKAFQVLAYDQRGLGQSEKPDRPYSMADYADDTAGLMDALGWDSCDVIVVTGDNGRTALAVARAVGIVRPRVCIPVHWDTLRNWLTRRPAAPPDRFAELVRETSPSTRMVILQPGKTWETGAPR
jgi:pimeloyl-ACP methyl ester carboxylesterase